MLQKAVLLMPGAASARIPIVHRACLLTDSLTWRTISAVFSSRAKAEPAVRVRLDPSGARVGAPMARRHRRFHRQIHLPTRPRPSPYICTRPCAVL